MSVSIKRFPYKHSAETGTFAVLTGLLHLLLNVSSNPHCPDSPAARLSSPPAIKCQKHWHVRHSKDASGCTYMTPLRAHPCRVHLSSVSDDSTYTLIYRSAVRKLYHTHAVPA